MKLLLKLKTLFILLLLFSCQPTGSSEYIIENTTDYTIRIEGFVRISYVEGDIPVYKDKLYAETILIPARSRYSTVRAHASSIEGGILKEIKSTQ